MKIRLFGDSIRLRLTQVEVEALAAGGAIESVIPFPGEALACSVQSTNGGFEARHAAGRISVSVPYTEIVKWASSDEEGVYGTADTLGIAVEKDYRCIHKPDSPDNAGTYPNPIASTGDKNIG